MSVSSPKRAPQRAFSGTTYVYTTGGHSFKFLSFLDEISSCSSSSSYSSSCSSSPWEGEHHWSPYCSSPSLSEGDRGQGESKGATIRRRKYHFRMVPAVLYFFHSVCQLNVWSTWFNSCLIELLLVVLCVCKGVQIWSFFGAPSLSWSIFVHLYVRSSVVKFDKRRFQERKHAPQKV